MVATTPRAEDPQLRADPQIERGNLILQNEIVLYLVSMCAGALALFCRMRRVNVFLSAE